MKPSGVEVDGMVERKEEGIEYSDECPFFSLNKYNCLFVLIKIV